MRAKAFARLALLAVASGLAVVLGWTVSAAPPGAAPPWLLDGLLLGVALLTDRRRLAGVLVSGGLGAVAGWMAIGTDLVAATVLLGGSALLLAIAAQLLRYLRWRPSDMATMRGLARGAAVVLLAAPVVPSVLVALLGERLALLGLDGALWPRLLIESLGLAVMVPLVITLARRDLLLLLVPPLLTSSLVLAAAYSAVAALVFLQHRLPLGFLLFPPLLLLVGRLGFPGAGLGILVTGAIALLGAAFGEGPIGFVPDATGFGRLAFTLFMLVVASAMVYPLAAAVSERRRMSQALSDQHARVSRNEQLYRLLANNASDIITRVRLDGRRLYVSPAVEVVLGWTPEEMLRPDWQNCVHPDDRPGFVAAREQMARGVDYVSNVYRYQRRDETWCWIEARLHLVRGRDGTPKEFVANLRDITDQKRAELALETALSELAETAATDGLTGVANRRRFDEVLDLEWRRALRAGDWLGVLLIDADHFKAFNDSYGHQAGDDCLRAIAHTTAAQIRRPHDTVARYGGEEFVVILPNTHPAGASEVAERIRRAIAALGLPHQGNAGGTVTVSIGACAMRVGSGFAASRLVEAADRALYVAKRGGRDRVHLSPPPETDTTVVPLLPHLRRNGTGVSSAMVS